jgi:hypothetical protein
MLDVLHLQKVCAKEANSQGYSIFGLKAGMCQVLNSTDETARQYLFNVPSTKCKDLKIGAVDAIDVYNIGNGMVVLYICLIRFVYKNTLPYLTLLKMLINYFNRLLP